MSTITDSEIIKALECCLESECERCQYQYDTACKEYILHGCLSFINHQKAEIDKLNKKVEQLSEVLSDSIKIKAKEIKSEAIKEFAERVKEESFECDVSSGYGRSCYEDVVTVNSIDVLAKEMVGENR